MNPKLSDDFKSFQEKSYSPDSNITHSLLERMRSDLNPPHQVIFRKLIALQLIMGFITIFFCPQFKMSYTNNYQLFHYFHDNFGPRICMTICGLILIGSTAIMCTLLMNKQELQKLNTSPLLYFTSISILALAFFLILGAKFYLVMVSYWLLGAIIGSYVVFKTSYLLRYKLT